MGDLLQPDNPGEELFSQPEWARIGTVLKLPDRLLEVAILLVEGHCREAIARRMRKADGSTLSKETVRVYIDRLFEKVNVRDKFEFAIRLFRIHRQLTESAACKRSEASALQPFGTVEASRRPDSLSRSNVTQERVT